MGIITTKLVTQKMEDNLNMNPEDIKRTTAIPLLKPPVFDKNSFENFEVIQKVLGYIPTKELWTLRLVNRHWNGQALTVLSPMPQIRFKSKADVEQWLFTFSKTEAILHFEYLVDLPPCQSLKEFFNLAGSSVKRLEIGEQYFISPTRKIKTVQFTQNSKSIYEFDENDNCVYTKNPKTHPNQITQGLAEFLTQILLLHCPNLKSLRIHFGGENMENSLNLKRMKNYNVRELTIDKPSGWGGEILKLCSNMNSIAVKGDRLNMEETRNLFKTLNKLKNLDLITSLEIGGLDYRLCKEILILFKVSKLVNLKLKQLKINLLRLKQKTKDYQYIWSFLRLIRLEETLEELSFSVYETFHVIEFEGEKEKLRTVWDEGETQSNNWDNFESIGNIVFPKLNQLSITSYDYSGENVLSYENTLNKLSLNFPNLTKLTLKKGMFKWKSKDNCAITFPNLNYLKVSRAKLCLNLLERLYNLFPNVKILKLNFHTKVISNNGSSDECSPKVILKKLWTFWSKVTELYIRLNVIVKDFDEVLTGLKHQDVLIGNKLLSEGKAVYFLGGQPQGQPSIMNLKNLEKLQIKWHWGFWCQRIWNFTDEYLKEIGAYITDISAQVCFRQMERFKELKLSLYFDPDKEASFSKIPFSHISKFSCKDSNEMTQSKWEKYWSRNTRRDQIIRTYYF